MREAQVPVGLRCAIQLPRANKPPHVSWDVVTLWVLAPTSNNNSSLQQLQGAISALLSPQASAILLPWREAKQGRGYSSHPARLGWQAAACQMAGARLRPLQGCGHPSDILEVDCGCAVAKFKQEAHSLLPSSTWSSTASEAATAAAIQSKCLKYFLLLEYARTALLPHPAPIWNDLNAKEMTKRVFLEIIRSIRM